MAFVVIDPLSDSIGEATNSMIAISSLLFVNAGDDSSADLNAWILEPRTPFEWQMSSCCS